MQPTARARRVLAPTIWSAMLGVASVAQGQTWVGPSNGPWSDPLNWSTLTIPNSPVADVLIDSNDTQITITQLDVFALIRSLQIDSADQLQFDQNTNLVVLGNGTFASVHNFGSIVIGPRSELLSGVSGTLKFDGAGTVALNGSTSLLAGSGRIVNVDNTISGDGTIGGNSAEFTNAFLIDASTPARPLLLDPAPTGASAFINNGTLSATAGWLLVSGNGGGDFDNTNGFFQADAGTIALVSGATIVGGTFQSSAGSRVEVAANHAASISAITNNSFFNVDAGATLTAAGAITNNGSIQLYADSAGSSLLVNGSVSFAGTGELILTPANGGAAIVASATGGLLINGAGHRIKGGGFLGNNSAGLQNHGVISATDPLSFLIVDPGNAPMLHNGTFIASNGATLRLSGAGGQAFIGTGAIHVDPAAVMQFSNQASVSFSGQSTVNGTMSVIGSSKVALAGISGVGTVQLVTPASLLADHVRVGTLIINGGTATLRAGGGTLGTSAVKSLSITTALDLTDHALLVDFTGPSPIGQIAAYLQTGYAGGSWNGVGIQSRVAANDPTRRTALGYALASDIVTAIPNIFAGQPFDSDTVIVDFTLYGDANLDHAVNLDDFTALAASFGGPARWSQGDFDYNGVTNLDDFTRLAANFGQALPVSTSAPGGPASAVPEPALGWVALLLTCSIARGRRTASGERKRPNSTP